MRVLVTGGAGYIGSVTAAGLLDAGHEVRVLDSLLFGGESLLMLYTRDGFRFVRGDIRSEADVAAALEGVDAVVHLAAIVGDPACQAAPALAHEVNQDASNRLFDAASRSGVERFVFASTCSNYGRMSDALEYVTEDTELRPLSVYAETKVAVEQRLLASANGGPAVTVLRLATVHGLSARPRFDLTVNEFALELSTKRALVVFGEQFWRPYVHVRDVALAIGLVLEAPLETVGGAVFNVGSTDENYRKGDIVELVKSEVGDDVAIEYVHRDEDPRDYRVSFERFRTALGFEPTRRVPDGIREILDAVASGVVADGTSARFRNS